MVTTDNALGLIAIVAAWRWRRWGVFGWAALTLVALVHGITTRGWMTIAVGVVQAAALSRFVRPIWFYFR